MESHIELDSQCTHCNGFGHYEDRRPCGHCDEKGALPTEAGYELLAFLKKYWKSDGR